MTNRRTLIAAAVAGVLAPTFGVAGKSVRIPFTIDSALPRSPSSVY